jgi:catechol 2,3-dioxygenase-like lactoylglutathione lyase family enzyme
VPWQLDHVQLAIPPDSEDRCDAFYVDLLGFATLEKPPVLAARGGRWYRRGDATLHLGVESPFRPAKKAHPAFAVDDYDVVLRQLTSAGYETIPDDAVPGRRRCYVEDPVGNRLELIDAPTPR